MAGKNTESGRIVALSEPADRDQSEIYLYSAQNWGQQQAEQYLDYIDDTLQALADSPRIAPLVPGRRNTRVYFIRWKNARNGHNIFFREVPDGILVLRILGSAMNWPDHIDPPDQADD